MAFIVTEIGDYIVEEDNSTFIVTEDQGAVTLELSYEVVLGTPGFREFQFPRLGS